MYAHNRIALLHYCTVQGGPRIIRVSEVVHVKKLVLQALSIGSIWHAAGVIADAVLNRHGAQGLTCVYAPKAHGAWHLQAASKTSAMATFALFSSVAALLGIPVLLRKDIAWEERPLAPLID